MPRTWFCWILWPQKIFVTPQIQSRSNQSNLPHWMLLVRIWPAWAFITDLSHWSVFTISTIVSKLAIDHWHELQYQKGCTVQGVCDLGSNMIGHTCHGSLPAITLIIYWKMSKPLWLFSGHKQCASLGMKLLHLFACISLTLARTKIHFGISCRYPMLSVLPSHYLWQYSTSELHQRLKKSCCR